MIAAQRTAALSGRTAAAKFGPALPSRPAGRNLVIRRFRSVEPWPDQRECAALAAGGFHH